ncbi:hypothetical protein RRG08_009330 [Elysia crispata]|uniref:Uncharacterized protein n=1 Tax=Elysia crispata TaxID=231223 RepID=A0AAE1DKD7_9GAST|nr:hypothetical protein RRG08_009330 [Elysia crispata]
MKSLVWERGWEIRGIERPWPNIYGRDQDILIRPPSQVYEMNSQGFRTELPNHGVPSFISDLAASSPHSLDGKTVRVVGRVERYEAPSNQALLSEPNNNSGKLLVDASLTDADNFRPGSLVMLIGELGVVGVDNTGILNLLESGEANEGIFTGQISLILTARVAVCVDRLDYTLYARAVQVWRDLKEEQT